MLLLCVLLQILHTPLAVDGFSPGKESSTAPYKPPSSSLFATDINIDTEASATASSAESPPQQQRPKQSYSRALESMLQRHENNGDGSTESMTLAEFFQSTWQQSPAVFRGSQGAQLNDRYTTNPTTQWSDEQMQNTPYETTIQHGWRVLTDLLEQPIMATHPQTGEPHDPPLVIHNGDVQHPQEWMPAYGTTSLYAPYLNGSSIMQAHSDCLSPWLAGLCADLEQTFPYVYANTYLTPPSSRALNLHADDRDVFVIQLVGSKQWEVKKEIPIDFPYPHEQVGKKDELPVPQHVKEGEASIQTTLHAGDVLYIPRGHCHHAKCTDDLSFHVTIAVATFDWTLAGMLHMASKNVLMNQPQFRKGLLPLEGLVNDNHNNNPREALQAQIDSAINLLHETVTPEAVLNNLQARIEPHRQRAKVQRDAQLERGRTVGSSESSSKFAVGSLAAKSMTLSTTVRAATAQNKADLQDLLQNQRPSSNSLGHMRDDLTDDAKRIVAHLQQEQVESVTVTDLKTLLESNDSPISPVWCDLAWLGFAKQAVELGVLAVVGY